MDGFTIIDGVVALFIVLSALLAYSRGFVREALAIAGWIVAGVVAFIFAPQVEPLVKEVPVVGEFIADSCELSMIGAFAVVFALALIVASLITPLFSSLVQRSALGGIDQGLGFVFGVARGVFSNEAGLGSASIAHAAARTRQPVSEGYVALLEPFIDTVVICTMTALVIITTVYDPALAGGDVNGIELTAAAFASVADWAPVPLSIAAILFAFSTIITWSYYGLQAFLYLVGDGRAADLGFKLFFLSFVVLGSGIQLGSLVDLSDALVFLVAIPNLIGLYLLAPRLRRAIDDYQARIQAERFPE